MNGGRTLKKYIKESKIIGGRINKSRLDFLTPYKHIKTYKNINI